MLRSCLPAPYSSWCSGVVSPLPIVPAAFCRDLLHSLQYFSLLIFFVSLLPLIYRFKSFLTIEITQHASLTQCDSLIVDRDTCCTMSVPYRQQLLTRWHWVTGRLVLLSTSHISSTLSLPPAGRWETTPNSRLTIPRVTVLLYCCLYIQVCDLSVRLPFVLDTTLSYPESFDTLSPPWLSLTPLYDASSSRMAASRSVILRGVRPCGSAFQERIDNLRPCVPTWVSLILSTAPPTYRSPPIYTYTFWTLRFAFLSRTITQLADVLFIDRSVMEFNQPIITQSPYPHLFSDLVSPLGLRLDQPRTPAEGNITNRTTTLLTALPQATYSWRGRGRERGGIYRAMERWDRGRDTKGFI